MSEEQEVTKMRPFDEAQARWRSPIGSNVGQFGYIDFTPPRNLTLERHRKIEAEYDKNMERAIQEELAKMTSSPRKLPSQT